MDIDFIPILPIIAAEPISSQPAKMTRFYFTVLLLYAGLYASGQAGNLHYGFNGGSFITTIGDGGSQAEDLVVQPDGKLIAVGQAFIGGISYFAITRYNTDGTLDLGFGNSGKVTTLIGSDCWADCVALQADGKIIVGGYANTSSIDFAVARYNTNGSPDLSFGTGGFVTTDVGLTTEGMLDTDRMKDLAVHSDGRIVAVGETFNGSNFDIGIVQYYSNGSILSRTTMALGQDNDFASRVLFRSDGKILFTGTSFNSSNTADVILVQYQSSGTVPDFSFGNGGIVIIPVGPADDYGKGLALQSDGKIVVTGITWQATTAFDIFILRFMSNGIPDAAFGTNGKVIADISGSFDDAIGIAVQSDGKLLIGGSITSSALDNFALIRFTSSGTLDAGFGLSGRTTVAVGNYGDVAYAMALSGTRIYLGGLAHRSANGSPSDFAIAAFQNDAFPLPLQLTLFTAQKQGSIILLRWRSESEQNIDQYIVERSEDGRHFSPLESIPSERSNAAVKNYTATDKQPFALINHYRLKILETNGSFTYSRIIAIKNNNGLVQLFPNPATSYTSMQLPAGLTGNVEIRIFETGGRQVGQSFVESAGNTVITLPLGKLLPGAYFICISAGGEVFTERLVKQ